MRKLLAWFVERVVSKIGLNYHRDVEPCELDFFQTNDLDGHILCTKTPWQLSNIFIPNKYKHVEIIIGSSEVAGAVTKGVTVRSIESVLAKSSDWAVFQPKKLNTESRSKLKARAIDLADDGLQYDWELVANNDAYYCSEFVVECYNYSTNDKVNYGSSIYPCEIYTDGDNWGMVFEWPIL